MGKIYRVDFEDGDRVKTMPELFESIQLYRSEGRSLSKICTAFIRSGLWGKGQSSFSNEYYQHRQRMQVNAGGRKKSQKQSVSENQEATQPIAKVDDNNAEANSQADTPLEIVPDMTLAQKRALSARLFKQRNQ